jgi:penicillin-binding protein 2
MNYQGQVSYQALPLPDYTGMVLADSTWDAIHRGMIATTEGWGTATNHFRNFPFRVAGKTGTAEQVQTRPSHSSFGGFAPYEDPQIAIYVTIPFGDTRIVSASATQVARDVIYAFLTPDVSIERPLEVNAILR